MAANNVKGVMPEGDQGPIQQKNYICSFRMHWKLCQNFDTLFEATDDFKF